MIPPLKPADALTYHYTGTVHPPKPRKDSKRKRYPYLPAPDLIEAVNLAIALGRPLLLEGDPGCGKTCLAEALAYELAQQNQVSEWPYYPWYVKSSTRGQEGLYRFDAIARLRDAQLLGANLNALETFLDAKEIAALKQRLKDKHQYLEFGPLGKAIQQPQQRAVVLIDEVDKADGDFANDLLLELERFEFKVPEISDRTAYPADPKTAPQPIIILTSNREKPLPAPFLRRCLYFYVEFPRGDRLRDIVIQRFGKLPKDRANLVTEAIAHVEAVRTWLQDQPGSRPPGTSEFLDFLQALWAKDPEVALQDLRDLGNRRPLLGILLKTQEDQARYRRKFGK